MPRPRGYFWRQTEAFRRRLVVDALVQTKGNRAQAARILEVERTYLYLLIKQWKLGELFPSTPGRPPTKRGALPPTL